MFPVLKSNCALHHGEIEKNFPSVPMKWQFFWPESGAINLLCMAPRTPSAPKQQRAASSSTNKNAVHRMYDPNYCARPKFITSHARSCWKWLCRRHCAAESYNGAIFLQKLSSTAPVGYTRLQRSRVTQHPPPLMRTTVVVWAKILVRARAAAATASRFMDREQRWKVWRAPPLEFLSAAETCVLWQRAEKLIAATGAYLRG